MRGSWPRKCSRSGDSARRTISVAVMSLPSSTKSLSVGRPIMANRVLALVRKVFNWAIGRDLLDHNPCLQVKRPGKRSQRDRVLNEEEIRAVWEACGQLTSVLKAYCKLRLLTAQRGGEVRTMRWADIDLETGWWTIPASIAKNGLAHRVPLSPAAQDISGRYRHRDEAMGVPQSPTASATDCQYT